MNWSARLSNYFRDDVIEHAAHSAIVIILLGLLAVISLWFRSWYHKDSGPADVRDQMLLQFRDLQRRGQLSPDEYRNISSRLLSETAATEETAAESDAAGADQPRDQ